MIYAVLYSKGGVGKTTIAAHLATHIARSGQSALLIDADPQESAATWAAWRREATDQPSPTTVRLRNNAVYDEGKALSQGYDHTVIDAGGASGAGLKNALMLAQRVIVPMGITGLDAAALEGFLELVDTARIINRSMMVSAVINRANANADDSDLRDYLAGLGMPVFRQPIRERRAYQKALTAGLTVEEHKPLDAAAKHEMRRLYAEIDAWAHHRPGQADVQEVAS